MSEKTKEEKKPLKKTVSLGKHNPFSLAITTGRLIKAKKKDLDIADPDNGIMGAMFVDPIVLAENVFVIYGDLISKAGIETEDEFYDLLDDEGNRSLDEAFKNAVRDFFTWGATYVDHVEGLMSGADDRIEQVLQEAMAGATETSTSQSQEESGTQSGSGQESSE